MWTGETSVIHTYRVDGVVRLSSYVLSEGEDVQVREVAYPGGVAASSNTITVGAAPPVDFWQSFDLTAGDFPDEMDAFQTFDMMAGDF